MADHSDAPDPRTDITDLFVFQAPRGGRTVLILNINPEATAHAESFDPSASYELKIDADGDLEADVAFHIQFASARGTQTASVHRSVGPTARGTGPIGEMIVASVPVSVEGDVRTTIVGGYRFFAGLRSDPWFADVGGFLDDFRFTGQDTFADRNVFGIVLEVPNATLGAVVPIRIWARTMARVHGAVTQVDQIGRPLVNAIFNRTATQQVAFNETPPPDQLARFGDHFAGVLRSAGYPDAEAIRLASDLLPDVLTYDWFDATGYPNGRRLTDDILDLRVELLTRGRVKTDLVGPHADLLDEFPYLAPPHTAPAR